MHTKENPCGLDGFAFLEFSGPDKNRLHQQFLDLGFQCVATHQLQEISLFRQGSIDLYVNNARDSQAEIHAQAHGAGACAMGFKVHDAKKAYEYALQHGATAFTDCSHASHQLPAIQGIGGSVIYFVDAKNQPFGKHLQIEHHRPIEGNGLLAIDHLTHNVVRGTMDQWAKFYETIFNFKELRFFNIKGKMTGLVSRALGSPCGKIKIPLNESKDDKSQIEEFLHDYQGEGIQHIAFSTNTIYSTVNSLRKQGIKFLNTPDTYYELIQERLPWHQEPLAQLKAEHLLIDGEVDPKHGLLLQIFTENVFGPVFFEIIQRKGNQGFGEGNFQALFEAIERDQVRRGTLRENN